MESFKTGPVLNELEQIRAELPHARSTEELRTHFERLRFIRAEFQDDFDALVAISSVQNEIVERARELQHPSGGEPHVSLGPERSALAARRSTQQKRISADLAADESAVGDFPRNPEAAEIAPEVERLDPKVWQRTLYLALFFGLLLFAGFFYLIQTARRLNLTPDATPQTATQTSPQQPGTAKPVGNNPPPPPSKPAVRLYTDLVPGAVTIDGGTPQDLKDGELILDNLQPGQHSVRIAGHGGNAEFSYDVSEKTAPNLVGLPTASNAMAVLVSSENGKARLVTNAEDADIMLDNKPAGHIGAEGIMLDNLGKEDHLLQVTQGKDRQRFVWTYTAAPTLTVYVKSDPNAGTVVVLAQQDGADVHINDTLYRRKTEAGQIRIPLKVGEYTISVHKAGFLDPPPQRVTVRKGEETAANFRFDPIPKVATLQVKGALPGTMVFVDGELGASIGAGGLASISNIKAGEHLIELRRDQALPKQFQRTFKTGDTVILTGPDVTLEKSIVEATPTPPPTPTLPAPTPSVQNSMQIEGEQVKHGGGFVPYHVPRVPGHYYFAGQPRKTGFLKRGKLQWYAGYQDAHNYVLFVADGKHVSVKEVREGKSEELTRVPFSVDPDTWVQVEMTVKPNAIGARVKTPESDWQDLGTVPSPGRDFTQNNVGLYVPGSDEVAIANFRFSNH